VRNIWIAEAPDYTALQLTAYAEDDGQALGDLAEKHHCVNNCSWCREWCQNPPALAGAGQRSNLENPHKPALTGAGWRLNLPF
jgi:hypothetical protein